MKKTERNFFARAVTQEDYSVQRSRFRVTARVTDSCVSVSHGCAFLFPTVARSCITRLRITASHDRAMLIAGWCVTASRGCASQYRTIKPYSITPSFVSESNGRAFQYHTAMHSLIAGWCVPVSHGCLGIGREGIGHCIISRQRVAGV